MSMTYLAFRLSRSEISITSCQPNLTLNSTNCWVSEDPIDHRQQYLDVMCFPTLYPTGRFGKYHPCEVKISHSEFDKSRLLNKYSRFRKDPQYVFHLLWQKQMRELSAGVYSLLKQSRVNQRITLLNNVEANDKHLEANLCTMYTVLNSTGT